VTKLNKPRAEPPPNEAEARSFLTAHEIDAADVTRANHSSDGSLLVVTDNVATGAVGHVFEHNPSLSAKIVAALKALKIEVIRGE